MIGTLAQIAFSLGCGFAQGDRASFSFCQFLPFTLNHRRSFTCCPPWLPRHWRCSHHTVCSSVFSLLCFPNATSSSTLLQLGMLAHSFPPSKARSMAFATFAAGAPVGGAVGMIIGGVLTQLTACVITARFYGSTIFNIFLQYVMALRFLFGRRSIYCNTFIWDGFFRRRQTVN